MFIIVEGPDGAGKTTLIEAARSFKRYFLQYRSSGPTNDMKLIVKTLFWVQMAPREIDIICDRLVVISDRVYGPILRNIDLFANHPLDFGLGKLDVLVYCRPPNEVLMKNANEGVHIEGVREQQQRIVQGYDDLINKLVDVLNVRVIEYDFTKDDPIELWTKVFGPR